MTNLQQHYVVFMDAPQKPYLSLLKRGFRHCAYVARYNDEWVIYDPLSLYTDLMISEDETLFFICDVSGKSISAALIVSTIFSAIVTFFKLRKEFDLCVPDKIDDISMQSSCSNYEDKVINDKTKLEFVSGAHFAVKASAYYNFLLTKNPSLQEKYEFIKSGSKIKRAIELGIKIISEDEWTQIVKEESK